MNDPGIFNLLFSLAIVIGLSGCNLPQTEEKSYVGFPFIEILNDNSEQLTFEDVLNKDSSDFQRATKYFLTGERTYWVKIDAPDLVKKKAESHFFSLSANAKKIELHHFKENAGWVSIHGKQQTHTLGINNIFLLPSFDLSGIDHDYPIYIKLESPAVRRFYFISKNDVYVVSTLRNSVYTFMLGIFGFIIFVNLVRGIRSKNFLVLLYAAYIFGFFMHLLTESRTNFLSLFFDFDPFDKYWAYHIVGSYVSITATTYALSYLKLKEEDKTMFYSMIVLGSINFGIWLFITFTKQFNSTLALSVQLSILFLMLGSIYASIRSLMRGNKYVIYYLFGYLAWIVSIMVHNIFINSDPEFLYKSIFNFYHIGMVAEVLLLNIALNERIVFERKKAVAEKATAQNELIAFQSEQNVILEKKIKERTIELEEANESIRHKSEQLQESFEKQEELIQFKEGMVQMIAHDMKNSLNSIIGFSASESFNKRMQKINQSGTELLRMVTNMLGVHKFEEAGISLKLIKTDVKDLVDNSFLQVALLLQMKSLRTNIKAPKKLYVNVDRDIMGRVLVNLLTNAIKFSLPGREISAKAYVIEKNGETVCEIAVTDQGDGIDENALPYIFDKFWQGQEKKSGVAASTGLGLSFCKMAVESHEGSIEVESKKGEGSTFKIILPILDKSGAIPIESESSVHGKSGFILDEERATIIEYIEVMSDLKVYQIGELNILLDKLEKENIRSRWKTEMELAISASDERKYEDLLNMTENLS